MKKLLSFLLVISLLACDDEDMNPGGMVDNFDRTAMLVNWADNIIIPSFEAFAETTNQLKIEGDAFSANPSFENYENLVSSWETAYLTFQDVSMFEIGMAENLRFTNNLNIYPTDITGISENIATNLYNLELPSQIARQGFPAVDYLLFGLRNNQNEILDFYQNDDAAAQHLDYLVVLITRIDDLAIAVLNDWNGDFRNSFVENSGNSASASVDKLTNDYIFYYERHLRAGKIGIPAGVFSGSPLNNNVEAFYRKDLSKALFSRSLDAVQNFFNGIQYGGTATGESMNSYLKALEVRKNGLGLEEVINNQFDIARDAAQELSDNFSEQVTSDNIKILEVYDNLQLNVVNIKVDMLQAFNINVDFVDSDGD